MCPFDPVSFDSALAGWWGRDGATTDLTVEQGATNDGRIHGEVKESSGKLFNGRVLGWERDEGLNKYDGACPPSYLRMGG